MSSKKAKELKALALSLSIVNDDLTKKRYFRKSEYYKETDKYLQEVRARNLAALELAKELQREQPTISALITNVLNNAPVEVLGHGDDEEVKEGEIKTVFGPEGKPAVRVPGQLRPIVGSTVAEIEQKKLIREEAKGLTDQTLKEVIDKLRPIPEEKVGARELDTPAIRQRKALFEELINRKIDSVAANSKNVINITNEEIRAMSKPQIDKLLEIYAQYKTTELFEDFRLPDLTRKTINKHTKALTKRLDKMEKQQQAEVELQRRARVIAKPTGVEEKKGGDSDGDEELPKPTRKPRLTRKPTPPVGPPPKKRRGRPPSKEVQERKQMALEDPMPKKPRGRPRKKKEPIVSQRETDKFLEEMLLERQKALQPITKEQAEEPTAVVGQGLKDYMSYMKNKKPTKDMKKLILLIGSKQAGNNSPKLNLDIEKLIFKIKQDVEKKIKAHKTKLAKQELKAVAREKQKLKIKALAKKQLENEL
jgi:hypothetical protein